MRKKFGNNREKKEELEVDITSLLDILVILLVFLLKSYNPSDLKLETAKNVSIPKSKSQKLGHTSVLVQVGSDKGIWINDRRIGTLTGSSEKIGLLYDELLKQKDLQKKELTEIEGRVPSAERKMALKTRKQNIKKVNLVMDQSLPYSILRRVMHTSALAGYPEFKFIVQGNF